MFDLEIVMKSLHKIISLSLSLSLSLVKRQPSKHTVVGFSTDQAPLIISNFF